MNSYTEEFVGLIISCLDFTLLRTCMEAVLIIGDIKKKKKENKIGPSSLSELGIGIYISVSV